MHEVSTLVQIPLAETIRFEHTLVLAFRFDANALTIGSTQILAELDGECHRHLGPAKTVQIECIRTPQEITASATVFRDSSKPLQTRWNQVTPGLHHVILSLTRAKGPTSSDGILEVYFDGQPWRPLLNLPVYWRHHPSHYTIETAAVIPQSVFVGKKVPAAYLSPVIRRRHVRRRR